MCIRDRLEKVELKEGEPLKFRIVFDILPEVTVPAFRGIEVKAKRQSVTQDMVDAEIDRLRERAARFEPVEGRAAAAGDFVEVDIEVTDQTGGESRKREATLIEVGHSGNHPELNEALIGVGPGDVKNVRAQEHETEDPNSPVTRNVDYHCLLYTSPSPRD